MGVANTVLGRERRQLLGSAACAGVAESRRCDNLVTSMFLSCVSKLLGLIAKYYARQLVDYFRPRLRD